MTVVFVHGRGQGRKDKARLHSEWCAALATFPADYPEVLDEKCTLFPFYARILDIAVASLDGRSPRAAAKDQLRSNAVTAGNAQSVLGLGVSALVSDYQSELGWEIAAASPPFRVPAGESEGRQFDSRSTGRDAMRGELGNSVAIRFANLLKGNEALTQAVVDEMFTDVGVYLNSENARKDVNNVVAQSIAQAVGGGKPVVVVGHSLGSVVAYEVLANASNWRGITLVTLGSPLGLGAIRSRLTTFRARRGGWPQSVAHWFNFSDRRDIVALVSTLDRETFFEAGFAGWPTVLNWTDVRNEGKNHHSIKGYLSDPIVAKVIREHARGRLP